MSNREWAIAVLYTLSTAIEALFITGVCTSDSDIAVIWLILAVVWGIIWLILAVVWGIVIIHSLFSGGSDDDDIQEY